jgi:predicted metal-dependent peptidase
MKKVERAQMRVLFHVPFFAPAVARLPVRFDDSIPTACTDGKGIRWNREWFDALKDEVIPTVLCHEAMHCMLGHLWRMPKGGEWNEWNIACDHAVNLCLQEFSAQMKAQHFPEPFPFPDDPQAYVADPQYAGMAEEAIYGKIMAGKIKDPQGQPQDDGCGNGPAAPGSGKGKGKGKGKPSKGKGKPQPGQGPGQQQPQPNSMPPFGQIEQPQGTAQQQAQDKTSWDKTMLDGERLARGRGDAPGGIKRLVGEIVDPKLPWFLILRSFLREQSNTDWDFDTPALEYSDSGFLLPDLHNEKMGAVVFAVDTSGSIDRDMLAHFRAEEQLCLDEMRPKRLLDVCCDSRIHSWREYLPGDKLDPDAPGGGGTSFRPVFERLETEAEPPKCVVYLTDLDGAFPDKDPGYPVIWVTWTKGGKAPFGKVIYAGND